MGDVAHKYEENCGESTMTMVKCHVDEILICISDFVAKC